MAQITDAVVNGLMVVYFAVFSVAAYFHWRYSALLRKHHAATWAELSSPGILNISISSRLKSTGFLLRKDFKKLGDAELTGYGLKARAGLICIFLYLLAFMVLMLLAQYQNGVWDKPIVSNGQPLTRAGVAAIACVISYLISWAFFWKRLKQRHLQKWNDLGNPSFLNQTLSNSWRTSKFFLTGAFLELKDPVLNALAAVISILFLGFLWFFWFSR